MDNVHGEEEGVVAGFEIPNSPDSSYSCIFPGNEDETKEPPMLPPHLQQTLLSFPTNRDPPSDLQPQHVVLNHLYMENRDTPRSVVALGITHRYRSKFVTVVLYKPIRRRGTGRGKMHEEISYSNSDERYTLFKTSCCMVQVFAHLGYHFNHIVSFINTTARNDAKGIVSTVIAML